jgi:hypothetical protein
VKVVISGTKTCFSRVMTRLSSTGVWVLPNIRVSGFEHGTGWITEKKRTLYKRCATVKYFLRVKFAQKKLRTNVWKWRLGAFASLLAFSIIFTRETLTISGSTPEAAV